MKIYLEIEDDGEYPWRAFEFDGTNMTPEEPGVMITKGDMVTRDELLVGMARLVEDFERKSEEIVGVYVELRDISAIPESFDRWMLYQYNGESFRHDDLRVRLVTREEFE